MKRLLIGASCLMLAACGMTKQQEQRAADFAAQAPGLEACRAQYSDYNKDFVVRNKCFYEVVKLIRPYQTYPDLFDEFWASNAVVAEQLEAKKITMAQAQLMISQEKSRVTGEEQRRNLQRRSVAAQESVAAAANAPVFCNRIGNTVTCN